MDSYYSGTDVRIAQDGRVWVMVPAGVLGREARWKQVALEEVQLDVDYPHDLITRYARHPVSDLGLDAVTLSRMLGLPRRDVRKVKEMWSSRRYTRGSVLAVDLEQRELAPGPIAVVGDLLVYPFSAITGICTDPPQRLVSKVKHPGSRDLLLGQFPIPAEDLAREMGVPVIGQGCS